MRGLGAVVLSVCTLGLAGGVASASGGEAAQSPQSRELLVRFERGAAQARALAEVGATVVERLPVRGLVRVRLDPDTSIATAKVALERRPDVAYADPNATYRLFVTPNDTRYGELWGLPAISAPAAWDLATGSDSVAVAVVDSGVDYDHADLAPNIWTNPAETANGLDDDGNGLVDDLRGWDYYGNDAAPIDEEGHGTHVAGTIGARGNNNAGVVGVNWRVKLMALRAGDDFLSGAAIVNAFKYACAKGAKVVNGSFGGSSYLQAIHDAIAACPGTLFVFSAGNAASNNDAAPVYPCADPAPNIICVAASQTGDALAPFSNHGAATVDLAAPGANILSTVPDDLFAWYNGTSMAAPHVAGAAALVLAHRPTLTAAELRRALLLSVDLKPALSGVVATGGHLNVARALGQEVVPPTGLTATSPSHLSGVWSNRQAVDLTWGGATDANGIDGYSFAFSPVSDFVPDEVKDVEETTTSLTMPLADGDHWFHVRARDGSGNWGAAVHVGPIRIDSFQPVKPVSSSSSHRVGGMSADRTVEVAWTGATDTASGLDGFSVSWSQGRAAAADETKDIEEAVTRVTSPTLAIGAWWFNIRARDNAGNWSDTVSIGPFSIRGGPTACAVPRLRGLTLVGAKRLLAKRGCSLGRVTRARSRRVRRGRVLAQRPSPGLRLRRGARVAVVLSRGRR
jgi:thermitase